MEEMKNETEDEVDIKDEPLFLEEVAYRQRRIALTGAAGGICLIITFAFLTLENKIPAVIAVVIAAYFLFQFTDGLSKLQKAKLGLALILEKKAKEAILKQQPIKSTQ